MGTILKDMMLLFCIMVVASACTNGSSVDVHDLPPMATSTVSVTLSPTIMPSPTATSTPIPSPTYTPTPVPTATPDPATMCQVPGKDGRIFVINDEKLQEHNTSAEEALREVIRREYPGWAEYSQQLTFGRMVVTEDLARILLDAGYPCIAGPCPYQVSVNPQVILTVMTVQYGDEPPPGFDAWRTARQIARNIKRLYEENQKHPEMWQDRFINASSFVMYQIFGQEEDRLRAWCVAYHNFYALTQQVVEP